MNRVEKLGAFLLRYQHLLDACLCGQLYYISALDGPRELASSDLVELLLLLKRLTLQQV